VVGSFLGEITFEAYVENNWLPSKHLEATTRAACRSNLDRHFLPFFGGRPMARILPPLVQEWVTKATAEGLSPRSVRKYHVMLHSIFERAGRDQLILINPCEHTELPKIVVRRTRTLTPTSSAASSLRYRSVTGCSSQQRSRRACAGASSLLSDRGTSTFYAVL
jgi:hypothetical protein